jgi:hypothetical protein
MKDSCNGAILDDLDTVRRQLAQDEHTESFSV